MSNVIAIGRHGDGGVEPGRTLSLSLSLDRLQLLRGPGPWLASGTS